MPARAFTVSGETICLRDWRGLTSHFTTSTMWMPFYFQLASPRRLGRPGRSALFHVEQGWAVRTLLATPLDVLAAVSPRIASFRPRSCGRTSEICLRTGLGRLRRRSRGRDCPAAKGRKRPPGAVDCASGRNSPRSPDSCATGPLATSPGRGLSGSLMRECDL
jgi:hypothetical protein